MPSNLKIYQVVPELYPRLAQYTNGNFYDGNGNLINVNFNSGGGYQGPQGPQGLNGVIGSVYTGTFSEYLITPGLGDYIELSISPGLDFSENQSILISNELQNPYVEEYNSDSSDAYFVGLVDYYDKITGTLSIVIQYVSGTGLTFSDWYINLSGQVG
jgi:hypothetical protein